MRSRIQSVTLPLVLFAAAATAAHRQPLEGNSLVYGSGETLLGVESVEDLVLNDSRRKKELQLRITYPRDGGPFPVIVFSHGLWGSKDNYRALTGFWASHGYVTIQPTHSDSRTLGTRIGDPRALSDWQNRPADVSFVIDSLDEIAAKAPALKGKLDRQRIGVGGHSFGAGTAQLIGGARAFIRPGGREKSFEDNRVSAILIMSGQGPGEMLTERSWERFSKPMLVMSGTEDGPTRTGQPAVWRKKPYELAPPGDKYLFWVEGLDHGFGGISGARLPRNVRLMNIKANEDHVLYTKIATLAFWDAYLDKSKEARDYLKSDKLSKFSKGAVELQHK
jgi:dienelactone hydrolase